jgi:hypothetical protein
MEWICLAALGFGLADGRHCVGFMLSVPVMIADVEQSAKPLYTGNSVCQGAVKGAVKGALQSKGGGAD